MYTPSRQLRLVLVVLSAVVGVLLIVYFAFFAQAMVPVYQNIRESDASAIVAELDKAGIDYRLENEGRDILVAEDQAARARVVVAGSTVSVGGTVGFELFNDSDMGLTEFAQKINFQRAMQGELARTIMMIEGVSFARVHLALPERSIFRAAQAQPTAAVTIETTPGSMLTRRKVDGIRQLVASSVPGLSAFAVTVLDNQGDLLSGSPATNPSPSVDSEASALEAYYGARARTAVREIRPDLPFEISVAVSPADLPADRRNAGSTAIEDGSVPSRSDGRGNSLRVLVRTIEPLSDGERGALRDVLVASLGLDRSRGDVLNFTTGAIDTFADPSAQDRIPAAHTVTAPAPQMPATWKWNDGMGNMVFSRWTFGALLLLAILIVLLRPRRQLDAEQAASFAELLRVSAADRRDRDHE